MSAPDQPALHADLEPLAFLVGTWRGEGHGEYPTIEPFDYVEEISFVHTGKPWLGYSQRTRHAADGRPLHAESGYWRPVGATAIEVVLAYPHGHVEVSAGTLSGTSIELATSSIAAAPTAKRVDGVARRIIVDGDELRYELAMAAVELPLTAHLVATLHRLG